MTVIVGTDSYVSEVDLEAYALARGVTLSGDASVLLIKAMDYIELQEYAGTKSEKLQPLEFPRNGAVDVPEQIKKAQMTAALLYESGEDLLAPQGPQVTSETVVGAVSVTYSDSGTRSTVYGQLNKLLRPFLSNGSGGFTFEVVRA